MKNIHRFITLIAAGVLLSTPASVVALGAWTGKPLSAMQVETNQYEPGDIQTHRIYLSTTGYRAESLGADGLISIIDYRQHLCWFVQKDGTYIEDPLDPASGYCSPVEVPAAMEPRADLGGVLSTQPCDGYDLSRQLGTETVNGRNAQKWACGHSPTRKEATHWFDPVLKLVVREKTDDGTTIEIRNIQFAPQPASLFRLPSGLTRVPRLKMPF